MAKRDVLVEQLTAILKKHGIMFDEMPNIYNNLMMDLLSLIINRDHKIRRYLLDKEQNDYKEIIRQAQKDDQANS